MVKKQDADRVMATVRARFEKSGMSLHALGLAMGYDAESARKSAWQFMKTEDPRVSMLVRFAKAMGVDVRDLL